MKSLRELFQGVKRMPDQPDLSPMTPRHRREYPDLGRTYTFLVTLSEPTAKSLASLAGSERTSDGLIAVIENSHGDKGGVASVEPINLIAAYTYQEHRADHHNGFACPEADWKKCIRDAGLARIAEMSKLLDQLSTDTPCRIDVNGDCQEHEFFNLQHSECPNNAARRAVEGIRHRE